MKKLNTVLLVDDSNAMNDINSYYLESLNICDKIKVAHNGKEALDILSNGGTKDVDLIILDINMPVMDGFQFLEEYQKLPKKIQKPIIIVLLTTSISPEDINKARSFDCIKGYYNKPLTADQIQDIISKHF